MKKIILIVILFLPLFSVAQVGGTLKILVIDKKTETPLDSVKISAVTSGRDTVFMYTDSTGRCINHSVFRGIYHLTVERRGYETLEVKGVGITNGETTYLTGDFAIKLSRMEIGDDSGGKKKKGK
ncbi:MAG TPA: carboxypeptidase-like regulatory domain-containing protein [Bacteroidia bacterium]|nr:carboxypeptidase-like regulatory domain-containing protein [Bacteroidia bacterium]